MKDVPFALQGIGIPWFSAVDWEAARALIHDAHMLGQSHAEFVANVQRVEDDLRRQGAAFIRVPIALPDFTAWCRLGGRPVNAKSCAEYAGNIARQHDNERGIR